MDWYNDLSSNIVTYYYFAFNNSGEIEMLDKSNENNVYLV